MKDQPWTDEKRAAQAVRLGKALKHERTAIGEIGKAIGAVTAAGVEGE